jgi:TusA-related sulfurtransferase
MSRCFDARTLKCPLLFVKSKQLWRQLKAGETLLLQVSDRVGINDIQRYLDKHNFSYTVSPAANPANRLAGTLGDDSTVEFSIKGKEI